MDGPNGKRSSPWTTNESKAASVASVFARRTKSRAHFLHAGDAWYVAAMVDR